MMFDENGLSGDLFDFDGDGKTDIFEEAVGFAMLDDMLREEEEAYDEGFDDDEDI